MARALEQILAELQPAYDPQKAAIRAQQDLLPGQEQDQVKSLDAAKQDSFQQITDQANRRGLFYSGIPLAEQQRYTGMNYLPALANLKSRFAQQRFNLEDQFNALTKELYLNANNMRQQELDREESARQAAAARAASVASSPSFGFGGFGGSSGTTSNTQAQSPQTWDTALKGYLAAQYSANPGANRATQDSWVKNWLTANGAAVNSPDVWNYYNSLYPWETYNDNVRLLAPAPNTASLNNTAQQAAGIKSPINTSLKSPILSAIGF